MIKSLTHVPFLRLSETDLDGELHACAHEQEPKHEILKRIQEEAPVWRHLGRSLKVGAVLLLSLGKIHRVETLVRGSLELAEETWNTYKDVSICMHV